MCHSVDNEQFCCRIYTRNVLVFKAFFGNKLPKKALKRRTWARLAIEQHICGLVLEAQAITALSDPIPK